MEKAFAASVVVPTYNEAENLAATLEKILETAGNAGIDVELVVVDDDSSDGTGELADSLSEKHAGKIRVLHRKDKRGLSSAIMDGFMAASNEVVGVTDADMSHDIGKIPVMVETVCLGRAQLCIGSRYLPDGDIKNWGLKRKLISRGATILARPLTGLSDPVSGFFFLERSIIRDVKLDMEGYKLLLEIIVKAEYSNAEEVAYTFSNRVQGKSKLGLREIYYYMKTLMRLYAYRLGLRA